MRCELVPLLLLHYERIMDLLQIIALPAMAWHMERLHQSHLYSCNMTQMKHKDSNIHTAESRLAHTHSTEQNIGYHYNR